MSQSTLLLVLASVSFVGSAAAAAELKVESDKENVVASRLEGTWQPHQSLTQRLTGTARPSAGNFVFKSDPTVAGLIPDKYAEIFSQRGMKIYLAGHVDFRDRTHPFVVTQVHGNPHVIFWLERDGEPFGNGESFNVMLAVADDRKNDLLFVGGDFNNQPFSAFQRAKTEDER